MDPDDFERLAWRLLVTEIPQQSLYDRVAVLPKGGDRGRDLVLYRQGRAVGLAQCKRVAGAIGRTAVLHEACKFALHARTDATLMPDPDGFLFQFWTAQALGDSGRLLFDETDAALADAEDEIVDVIADIRKKYVTLRTPPTAMTQLEDAENILGTLRRWAWAGVDGKTIADRLQPWPEVRRLFFRGPDDRDQASTAQVDALLGAYRSEQIREFETTGRAGDAPYIARRHVEQAFEGFLSSGSRWMAVVGGTGHGKSRWAARHLEDRVVERSVGLVAGDDIRPEDANAVETLSRLLRARPLAGATGQDLTDAIWKWLPANNRLLIIDGLDRTPVARGRDLARWLKNTVSLAAGAPFRVIVTCREDAWLQLSAGLSEIASTQYCASGDPERPALTLGELDEDERRTFFAAYGVTPGPELFGVLRTPSLIRNFVRGARKEGVVTGLTRRAIFEQRLHLAAEEMVEQDVLRLTIDRTLTRLGHALLATSDAVIALDDLASVADDATLEAFIGAEILVRVGSGVRPAQDELAECLMARVMDVDAAITTLGKARTDDLYLGALTMAVQGEEAANPDQRLKWLGALIEGAARGSRQHFQAAFRVASQVTLDLVLINRLADLLHTWVLRDRKTLAVGLEEVVADLGADDRTTLALLMQLAAAEDADDWRTKYWISQSEGRWRSPFARIAEAVAARGGLSVAGDLLAFCEAPDTSGRVAMGLLFSAATSAQASVVRLAAQHPAPEPFNNLALLYPSTALEVLVDLHHEGVGADLIGKRLQIFEHWQPQPLARETLDDAVLSGLSRSLMVGSVTPDLRGKLLIHQLAELPDPSLAEELHSLLPVLDYTDIWRAVEVSGPDQERFLKTVMSLATGSRSAAGLLNLMPADAVSDAVKPILVDLLSTAADTDDVERLREVSLALETLLYNSAILGNEGMLWPLAERLAQHPSGDVRRPLIFFAGSPRRALSERPEALDLRQRLFERLVVQENGQTLEVLVWKIVQSAPERAAPLEQLNDLAHRFGRRTVETIIRQRAGFERQSAALVKAFAERRTEL